MRRGSLVGPLILIVIGVVFLLRNIRPDLPLFDLFMTYWPFLLIAWGGLRMVEILVTYFRGSALPASGVSGGEWALIIILTVIGSSVWGVQRFTRDSGFGRWRVNGMEVFGESFDYDVQQSSTKASKQVRVVVDNARGNTRVIGADVEEVKVSGRMNVRALNREEADKAKEKTQVRVDHSGDVVNVRGNQDQSDGPRVNIDLEITVPRGATIDARGKFGDFEISDVNGEVSIYSDNAGVRLQNLTGRAKVETRKSDIIRAVDMKGDIELKGRGRDIELENIAGQVTINGSYSGDTTLRKLSKPLKFESPVTEFRVEKVPGEVELSLTTLSGTNLTGPVTLRSKQSKDVRLTDVTDSLDLDVDNGNVEIRQSKSVGKMDVKVRNGSIEVALPQQAKFSVNASTERGDISNDFDSKLKTVTEDRGGRITGSLGPGPELKLSTRRGEVTLRKMSTAEASAEDETRTPKAPKSPASPAAPQRADNQ